MGFSVSYPVKRGDQIYLRYGGHSNGFLFAEYGFVLPLDIQQAHIMNGEITVDPDVEEMFRTSADAEAKQKILEDRNYWGWIAYLYTAYQLICL